MLPRSPSHGTPTTYTFVCEARRRRADTDGPDTDATAVRAGRFDSRIPRAAGGAAQDAGRGAGAVWRPGAFRPARPFLSRTEFFLSHGLAGARRGAGDPRDRGDPVFTTAPSAPGSLQRPHDQPGG